MYKDKTEWIIHCNGFNNNFGLYYSSFSRTMQWISAQYQISPFLSDFNCVSLIEITERCQSAFVLEQVL